MRSVAVLSAFAAFTAAARDLENVMQLLKRDGDCSKQPAGTGPAVTSPDTPAGFLAYQPFQDTANNAFAPPGYTSVFTNLQGSSQTTGYLGYTTLDSYSTAKCASYCDQLDGCQSFNIYYERDPTLQPNTTNCANPASLTNIKCVRWGVQVTASTATNTGQWRANFQVVIAGSNGYVKNAPPPAQAGFNGPTELGGAINAPLDPVTKKDTYLGYKFFSFGTGPNQVQYYNAGACTAACAAQSAYNIRHPAAGKNPDLCNFVVAYVLSDEATPQGMYCSMYTEAWAPQYATNVGQYRGSDYWSVSEAYAYTNATYAYPPICAVGGCPGGSYSGGNCGGYGTGAC